MPFARPTRNIQITQELQRLFHLPLGKRVHQRRPHSPTYHCFQQPEEARFYPFVAPTSASPSNNPCCRQCHISTPDFRNSLSTSSGSTRPTPDVIHGRMASITSRKGATRPAPLHREGQWMPSPWCLDILAVSASLPPSPATVLKLLQTVHH